jgi:ribonuclease P protein component
MKRFHSLKKNYEFREVYSSGKSLANRLLVMYVLPADREETRIGISVSKKIGNSVVRHHITRLIREAFRLNEGRIRKGMNIVVVARVAAKHSGYSQIESALMHLCGLHNLIENSGSGEEPERNASGEEISSQ